MLTFCPIYDALSQVRNEFGGNVISQYDYVCDPVGSRDEISRSGTMMSESRSDAYGYNERNELISAGRAELVSVAPEYAYQYDDIGNRITSSEIAAGRDELVSSAYSANSLNQYTSISNSATSAFSAGEFTPAYDDDGNQTLVQSSTGIWQVQYNGENRPVLWSNGATNITMKFDRMGRRVEYLETVTSDAGGSQSLAIETNTHHRFVYDEYLCIQRLNAAADNAIDLIFAWDPAERVATRPLMIEKPGKCMLHVSHDGNKNVSDLVFFSGGSGVAAHYEYAPFGALIASTRNSTSTAYDFRTYNPFRFSSEYADDALGLVYYNYRHYNPLGGRWCSRDPKEIGFCNKYLFLQTPLFSFDHLGLEATSCCGPDVTLWALQEMMILERWISQVRDMIHVWAEQEAPWYEPNFVREKSYSYVFMLILGPRLTYFPDTDFSHGASCATSQDCANTVTFHGRCVHSSEIGNFIYGFVARMFRMTWPQTFGGLIYGNRGSRTTADSAAVKYGWDAADEGWWEDFNFPEDGSLATDMATDAPVQCKPSKCSTVVEHIALPPVTPTMNHTPIKELKASIVVPQTPR